MSNTENTTDAWDRRLGVRPSRADEYDNRMIELGMAEPGQGRPGFGLFYGEGLRDAYIEVAVRYLGEMPDGSFESPQIARLAWDADAARKDLAEVQGEMQLDQDMAATGELELPPGYDWSKQQADVDAARERLTDAQQRVAEAQREELSPSEPATAEQDWTHKVNPVTLIRYEVAAIQTNLELDGGDPHLAGVYGENADWYAEQIQREIVEYDGTEREAEAAELDDEAGLEP